MGTFSRRFIGAAVLDPATYEDVEADRLATVQAFSVVLLASVAAGVGATGFGASGIEGVVRFGILALLGWGSWAVLTFEIGSRLMPAKQTRADVGQLLRTLGFSAAPGIVTVAGVLPRMAVPAFALATVWMLASMVVAVRQALDYDSTLRAVGVCLSAWALALLFVGVIGFFTGGVS